MGVAVRCVANARTTHSGNLLLSGTMVPSASRWSAQQSVQRTTHRSPNYTLHALHVLLQTRQGNVIDRVNCDLYTSNGPLQLRVSTNMVMCV